MIKLLKEQYNLDKLKLRSDFIKWLKHKDTLNVSNLKENIVEILQKLNELEVDLNREFNKKLNIYKDRLNIIYDAIRKIIISHDESGYILEDYVDWESDLEKSLAESNLDDEFRVDFRSSGVWYFTIDFENAIVRTANFLEGVDYLNNVEFDEVGELLEDYPDNYEEETFLIPTSIFDEALNKVFDISDDLDGDIIFVTIK